MVHCRTTPSYPSSTHPVEGDHLGIGGGYCDAYGSHTKRWKDISRIGAGAILTCKYENAVARSGKEKSGA
jgi:hypothetical protein